MEIDDLDELPPPLQGVVDDVLAKLVGAAVTNIDRAFRNAKLEAKAEIKRQNARGYELIVRSALSREEHLRAEAIADAVLQSTLIQASVDQPLRLH